MVTLLSILALIFAVLQIILFFKLWGMTNDIRVMKQNIQGVEYDFNHYMLLDEREKAFNLVKSRLLKVLMINKEANNNNKASFVESSKWHINKYTKMADATGYELPAHMRDAEAFWDYLNKIKDATIYREQ